jgi:exopolyphosphatase/guanosine-5'-triphosphate,3'-diphosphate pyrophosphatase
MLAKHCPDRINTIVPGILILDSIAKLTEAKKLTISRFSVREGYLCQRVLLRKI